MIPGKNRRLNLYLAIGLAWAMALLVTGCSLRANQDALGHPLTDEVSNWRQYLGVALAVQYLLLTWALWKTHKRGQLSRTFLGFMFIPLVWTILGEWAYRLGTWVIGWGWPGRLLAIVISFLSGITGGGGNIYPYLLGAVVFNDTRYLLYWSVPGIVAAYVAIFLRFAGKED